MKVKDMHPEVVACMMAWMNECRENAPRGCITAQDKMDSLLGFMEERMDEYGLERVPGAKLSDWWGSDGKDIQGKSLNAAGEKYRRIGMRIRKQC